MRQLDAVHRGPVLHWAIFTGLSLFAFALLWRFGLIQQMIEADRTHISGFITLLYAATTLHCLYRAIAVSREADAARWAARLAMDGSLLLSMTSNDVEDGGQRPAPRGLITTHIRDITLKAERQGGGRVDQTLLLRALAGRLRGSNQFGGFASDLLMKLGLIGTIIGFIIMLAPVATLDTADRGALKASMNMMSAGMAVAMYTTLAGLIGSILIKIQYFMLEAETAKLFSFAVSLVEVHACSFAGYRLDQPE